MANLRRFLRHLGGKPGKATHSKRGAHSHVNKARNKRAANKCIRRSRRIDCMKEK